MYGQPSNEKLIIESVQYTAAIEIPRTIGEIFQLKIVQESRSGVPQIWAMM